MTSRKKNGTRPKQPVPIPSSFLEDVLVSLAGIGDLVHVYYKMENKMKVPGPVYIQDETTGKIGKVIAVPKIGALMSSRRNKPGNYGFAIFLNPEDVIKTGSLVTFVSGEYRKEHIPVT
jgi:hypothetical protein